MKLLEIVIFCVVLTFFVRAFALIGIQIQEYRIDTLVYIEKKQEILKNYSTFLYKNEEANNESKNYHKR